MTDCYTMKKKVGEGEDEEMYLVGNQVPDGPKRDSTEQLVKCMYAKKKH